MSDHRVFYDPANRRAARVSFAAWVIAVASTILGGLFLSSLLVLRTLPELPAVSQHPRFAVLNDTAKVRHLLPSVRRLAEKARSLKRGIPRSHHPRMIRIAMRPRTVRFRTPSPEKPLAIGFYVNWDDGSYESLKHNLQSLDWVVPGWLTVEGAGLDLKTDLDPKALDFIRRTKPSASVLAMIQNITGNDWDGLGLARLLADPKLRQDRLQKIVTFLEGNALQGLVVDFEQIPQAAHRNMLAFLGEVRAAFHGKGLILAVAAPFDDPQWNYAAYAKSSDYLMLMAYDQHWAEGKPGPIAAQGWFQSTIAKRMRELDPARTIVAIGSYGYDWPEGGTADDLTFQEAMLTARDAQATVDFDPESRNPRFSYEEDGKTHRVWFLDAATVFNEIRQADKFRPAGYALWRLGAEDPSLWTVLPHDYGAASPAGLDSIAPTADIDFIGHGELLQIAAKPNPGERTVTIDSTGAAISNETYTKIPSSFVIRRTGDVKGKLALTFDDGPDPQWTPKILDILKTEGVHATFFIIGENGAAYPNLVQRIVAEGNNIGNHTFTHPNLGETPDDITVVELNATQRLIEALTGRSTRLFRPPYFGDAEPTTPSEILPIEVAEKLGYIAVGLKVDPDDWQQPLASEIVKRVVAQATDPDPEKRGHVILLHDAGGDRSHTVEALPRLIDALRAKGFEFCTISEMAGWSRDQAMPPVPPDETTPIVNRYVFFTLSSINAALHWLFVVAIGLGVARLLLLCGLALAKRESPRPAGAADLSVSVLIPAYNEARVIAASIGQILKSDYPRLKVIVIDDGSTDGTSEAVCKAYAGDSRVTLITTPNAGKARAVNTGLDSATGEVVVALDADTQFEPATITKLVSWFADPKVGAVAGNAKVGNRVNTLTRWQALEYITAQNLERRALAALGCITVVPGAIGAWRRETLMKLGGFPDDTLAEDQDLTITVQRAGYKVIFDPGAIAWTEAPDTLAGLAKQRFRWAFGTLQCLWKHSGATFNARFGALGLIALPQMWLFQIALALISPLVDLALVIQIARTATDYWQHGEQFNAGNLLITATYYAIFMAVDLSAAALAFFMERNEDKSLLWWLILQRFGYRQIMYYVVVKSVLSALRGRFVGWGKLERKGTVTQGEG